MIEDAIKRIEEISNDFPSIHKMAIKFVDNVNEKLSAEEMFISTTCPDKRTSNPLQKFQNKYHREIFDAVIGSMKKYLLHMENFTSKCHAWILAGLKKLRPNLKE